MQNRRNFLKLTLLGTAGIATVGATPEQALGVTTLSKEEQAEAEIFECLGKGGGYYHWARLDNRPGVYARIPNLGDANARTELWMKDEVTSIIHICDPIKMLEAIRTGSYEGLMHFSGYERNNHCGNCKKQIFGEE